MGFETFLMLGITVLAGVPLIWFAARRFQVGIALVFVAVYLKAFIQDGQGLKLAIAIYPLDIVFVLIGSAASVRMLTAPKLFSRYLPWLAFGSILAYGFWVGSLLFGTAAGVTFRKFFYFYATALYVMGFCMNRHKIDYVIRAWLIFSVLLVFSVIIRWVSDPSQWGIAILRGNSESSLRVIPSDMALILAQSVVLAIMWRTNRSPSKIWTSFVPVGIAIVVVLQHRSVWVAGALGIVAAYLLAVSAASARRMSRQLGRVGVVGTVGILLLVVSGAIDAPEILASLWQSFETGIRLQSTAGERLLSWDALMGMWTNGGFRVWFLGFPFGTSLAREVVTPFGEVRLIEYGAHNAYVELLLYTGLVGVTLFIATYVTTLWRLYRQRLGSGPNELSRILCVLVLMQLFYYVPYGVEFAQAVWLGMGLSLLAHRRSEEARCSPTLAKRSRRAHLEVERS
jgi:O-antigen ligase